MSHDIASPSAVAKKVNDPKAKKTRQDIELKKAYDEGHLKGKAEGHNDLIDWLQEQYLVDGPDRGSAEAMAILNLARDAANHFKGLDQRAANKRRRS